MLAQCGYFLESKMMKGINTILCGNSISHYRVFIVIFSEQENKEIS